MQNCNVTISNHIKLHANLAQVPQLQFRIVFELSQPGNQCFRSLDICKGIELLHNPEMLSKNVKNVQYRR